MRRRGLRALPLLLLLSSPPAAAEPGGVVPAAPAPSEKPQRLVLRSVKFPLNSTTVDAGSLATLELAAGWLKEHPRARLRIEGHSSAPGSEAYNRRLSEMRARGVKRVLVDYGVESDRIEVVGRGEGSPLAPNDTADGRALNRRVEFIVLDEAAR